ncbi:hypothetical protein [Psychrobacillus sp. NPDC096623]|uniref:hypothetical protein n=1 Tax=Psychrobacillus sp. NPDC096623 TaxID=3364492 RepID=UPI0038018DAD
MLKNYGKIAISIIFISMFLLILGIKYVLGQDLVIMNLLAFAAFSIVIGVLSGSLLLYKLQKAFYIFTIGLIIGFFEMYRSFFAGPQEFGDLAGILSLFIFTTFGFVIGLFVEAIFYLLRKNEQKD